MFNKLFGAAPKKAEAAPIDVNGATEKLQAKVEDIDMRIKKLENQMNDYRTLALEKKKKKDNTGAVNALRKAKMFEK